MHINAESCDDFHGFSQRGLCVLKQKYRIINNADEEKNTQKNVFD